MSDAGRKKPPSGPANWSHWRRPNTRMYDYNFEYGESYYQPQVRYLASISSETTNVSSSTSSYRSSARSSTRSVTNRSLRARSTPPPAQSFIERWTSDPFYGRYGPLPSWRRTDIESSSSLRLSAQENAASVSRSIRAASETRETSASRLERSSSVSRSVRASSETRISQLAQSSALSSSETNIRRATRASSLERSSAQLSSQASVASLRQRALACASSLEEISSLSSSTRSNIKNALARATETSALASAYDAYAKDYPRQHLVCENSCPLHNDPNFQKRFVLGNRYLDAAALGGFDVLYDPTASTKLIKKLRSVNETESEEISVQRSSSVERSRLSARYQEASW